MVNVKDLMVGNFVEGPCEPIEAYKLYACGIGNDCGDYYRENEIEPILVTIEMLKRIGFEAHKDNVLKEFSYYRYWDKEHKYKLDVCDIYTNSDRKWHVHIDNNVCNTIGSGEFDYVHELQNLTRIITGHSLPITKEMINGLEIR